MNKRELEATVHNLPHWLSCPIWVPEMAALEMVQQADGWFDCLIGVIMVFRQYHLSVSNTGAGFVPTEALMGYGPNLYDDYVKPHVH